VNIGDIAHTPGVLALLEKHLPEVEVRLWPSKWTTAWPRCCGTFSEGENHSTART
jgi:hypothetical protein